MSRQLVGFGCGWWGVGKGQVKTQPNLVLLFNCFIMFYLLNPCQSKAEFSKQGLIFICTVGIFKTDNQYKSYLANVSIILRAFGEMLHDVFDVI